MILRFVSAGVDLASVEAESGGTLQIVGASPVQTRVALRLTDGADRQATIDAMGLSGYAYEGDGGACPLIVVGEDDGEPYKVAIREGAIVVEKVEP